MNCLRFLKAAPVAILAALFLPAIPILAASQSTGQQRGGGMTAQQQQAKQQAASAKAAAITDAQAQLTSAKVALSRAVKKINADFQASPDLKTAQDAVTAANAAYDKAKATVLAALPAANPTYRAAKNREAAAQTKYDAGVKKGTNSASLSGLSQTLFDIGNITGPLEQAAFEKDAACVAAKKTVDDALAALSKLNTDFKASLKSNADYVAAKSAVDSAQADLTAAQNGTTPAP